MSEADKINEIFRLVVRIDDKVTDLRAAVFGNGRPGLTDRMTVIEQSHASLCAAHDSCPAREAISGATKRQEKANAMSLWAVILAGASTALSAIATFLSGK